MLFYRYLVKSHKSNLIVIRKKDIKNDGGTCFVANSNGGEHLEQSVANCQVKVSTQIDWRLALCTPSREK